MIDVECVGALTSNSFNPPPSVSNAAACGMPQLGGFQYARIEAGGLSGVTIPAGGPVPLASLTGNLHGIQVPIPAGASLITFAWEFFDAEGSLTYNDAFEVSVLDGLGNRIGSPLVYADVALSLANPGTCTDPTSFGTEIGAPFGVNNGPQIFFGPIPVGGVTLNIVCANSSDDAVASAAFIDDIQFDVPYTCGGLQSIWWQSNSLEASLDVDGVQVSSSFASSGATTTKCINQPGTVNIASSLVGNPFELAVTAGPSVSANGGGGFNTAGGQAVNLDFSIPGLTWLFGGPVIAPQPFAGSFSQTIVLASLITVSGQMIIGNPASADFFTLSQAATLVGQPGGAGGVAGPTADDTSINVSLTNPNLCGGLGSITFFGGTYTDMWISPNGRVAFGADPGGDFSPTLAEAASQVPFVGYWTDMNPTAGGNITVTVDVTGAYRVAWNAVVYFGTTVPNTFSVVFDPTGTVSLEGLPGIGIQPGIFTGGDDAFMGITSGAAGSLSGPATDGGPTLFSFGGSGSPVGLTDMIYDFYNATTGPGRAASLVPGTLNSVIFLALGNNYAWSGF
jgi:hypothetical protein